MAEQPREILQESDLPLGSNETSMLLNDVPISPTEPKTMYLFGVRLSLPSRESLEETALSVADVPISLAKKTTSRSSITEETRMVMNLLNPKDMSLFSASFNTKSSENPSEDISLASTATSMPLTNVSTSPTNKNELKTIILFGTRIPAPPQESSSLTSTATSMPLTDVTISPTKKRSRTSMTQEPQATLLDGFCLGTNPKELSLYSDFLMKTDENLKNHCLSNAESSENPKEELKEDARKIKKMRYLSNNERKVVKRPRVSMELDLNIPPCSITKELTESDIGGLSRLMLARSHVESHILSHLSADEQRRIQEGNGVIIRLYDHDKNTEHDLVLKRMVNSTGSYVFNGAWRKQFVQRRKLKEGHKIGLFWNSADSRFHFCVLSPTPADAEEL